MRAADLSRALKLLAQRDADAAVRDRLAAGDRLTIILGEHAQSVEIVVSRAFSDSIRATLAASFDQRVKATAAELAEMGVRDA